MRKRWRYLLAASLVACLAGGALFWYWSAAPELNVSGFGQIREGMTLSEVEEILGAPPGVYCDRGRTGIYWPSPLLDGGEELKKTGAREWVGKGSSLCVVFDADGRAKRVLHGSTVLNPSLWQRMRRWIGLEKTYPPMYPVPGSTSEILPD